MSSERHLASAHAVRCCGVAATLRRKTAVCARGVDNLVHGGVHARRPRPAVCSPQEGPPANLCGTACMNSNTLRVCCSGCAAGSLCSMFSNTRHDTTHGGRRKLVLLVATYRDAIEQHGWGCAIDTHGRASVRVRRHRFRAATHLRRARARTCGSSCMAAHARGPGAACGRASPLYALFSRR